MASSAFIKLVLSVAVLLLTLAEALQQPTRRAFVGGAVSSYFVLGAPSIATAGIDVSGLSVEGKNSDTVRNQLKAYDGSGASRVQEIKASSVVAAPIRQQEEASTSAATFALRYGDYTRLTKLGFGERYRLEDYIVGPGKSKVSVSFEFPSDWLQLDRILGGIQYVDQRNGDFPLYLLV